MIAWRLPALLALLIALGACATPNYVVLLDSGRPSAVIVSNRGGEKVLDKPGEAVEIPSAARAPEPTTLSASDITKNWGDAIAYQPPAPVNFVLYFVLDTTKLTPESRAELPKVLALIKERPAPEVAIVGYTDRSGTEGYNYQLGLRRAEAVKHEIEAIGVPDSLISVASYGSRNPLVETKQPYEPRNRRVEITVR
ncbi:MAG TPA: OmpA family protein [Alphaproteobacteria bacterium]|nr:OmpA family protein [Alphaproteobacteria bacterium]